MQIKYMPQCWRVNHVPEHSFHCSVFKHRALAFAEVQLILNAHTRPAIRPFLSLSHLTGQLFLNRITPGPVHFKQKKRVC